MILCLCSDPRSRHPGDGKCIHRACGCGGFRLDPRSRLNPEPGETAGESWLDDLAEAGPSIWEAKNAATGKAG